MSSFLGPIHFWLYGKIALQEELTNNIAELAVKNGWITDDEKSNYVFGSLPPLESVIDEENIHAWLQGRIHNAEERYALLVTRVIKESPEYIEQLESVARELGRKNKVKAGATPEEAYKKFDDFFLNGMPCDRVNEQIISDDDSYGWKQREDIHETFWNSAGGNVANYYKLRTTVMEGMLEDSGLTISYSEPMTWKIVKCGE